MKTSTKVYLILSLLWMAFIFIMSAQSAEASNDASESVTAVVVDTIYGDERPKTAEEAGWNGTASSIFEDIEKGLVPKDDIMGRNRFNFKNDIRKLAHIVMYFVLAVLINLTFISYFGKNRGVYALLSFAVCAVYASLDELHQVFVPERSGEWSDVGIDCFGAVCGIVAVAAVSLVCKKIKKVLRTAG